jgi:hypothetical protein
MNSVVILTMCRSLRMASKRLQVWVFVRVSVEKRKTTNAEEEGLICLDD